MADEIKKMINKSKLTKEELKQYAKMSATIDHKLDHSRAYRTMMNESRRELLKFIGCEIRSIEELKNNVDIEEDQLNYHLSMLKQCFYVFESNEGWKATPRGIGFLENAQLGNS